MKSVRTFTATIYVGSLCTATGEHVPLEVGESVVQKYVNEIGQCFTVTRTQFIYKNGAEPGLIVGAINYPRFPKTPDALKNEIFTLAEKLRVAMKQQRVFVVLPEHTTMLGTGKA